MSAESKKKRGESGKKNAEAQPFRGNGRVPRDYHNNTVTGRSDHPCGAGSLLVRAMNLGSFLPGFTPSERLIRMTDNAMARCTHSQLV